MNKYLLILQGVHNIKATNIATKLGEFKLSSHKTDPIKT